MCEGVGSENSGGRIGERRKKGKGKGGYGVNVEVMRGVLVEGV